MSDLIPTPEMLKNAPPPDDLSGADLIPTPEQLGVTKPPAATKRTAPAVKHAGKWQDAVLPAAYRGLTQAADFVPAVYNLGASAFGAQGRMPMWSDTIRGYTDPAARAAGVDPDLHGPEGSQFTDWVEPVIEGATSMIPGALVSGPLAAASKIPKVGGLARAAMAVTGGSKAMAEKPVIERAARMGGLGALGAAGSEVGQALDPDAEYGVAAPLAGGLAATLAGARYLDPTIAAQRAAAQARRATRLVGEVAEDQGAVRGALKNPIVPDQWGQTPTLADLMPGNRNVETAVAAMAHGPDRPSVVLPKGGGQGDLGDTVARVGGQTAMGDRTAARNEAMFAATRPEAGGPTAERAADVLTGEAEQAARGVRVPGDAEAGQALRDPVAAASTTAKARVDAAYGKLSPFDRATLPAGPIWASIEDSPFWRNVNPDTDLHAAEKDFLGRLPQRGETLTFGRARRIDQDLTAAIANGAKDFPTVVSERLRAIKHGINDALEAHVEASGDDALRNAWNGAKAEYGRYAQTFKEPAIVRNMAGVSRRSGMVESLPETVANANTGEIAQIRQAIGDAPTRDALDTAMMTRLMRKMTGVDGVTATPTAKQIAAHLAAHKPIMDAFPELRAKYTALARRAAGVDSAGERVGPPSRTAAQSDRFHARYLDNGARGVEQWARDTAGSAGALDELQGAMARRYANMVAADPSNPNVHNVFASHFRDALSRPELAPLANPNTAHMAALGEAMDASRRASVFTKRAAAGHLGEDYEHGIHQLLSRGDRTSARHEARMLVASLRDDPDALRGVANTVKDFLSKRVAGGLEDHPRITRMRATAAVEKYGDVARLLLPPEEWNTFQQVANEMKRADVTGLPKVSGSTTARNLTKLGLVTGKGPEGPKTAVGALFKTLKGDALGYVMGSMLPGVGGGMGAWVARAAGDTYRSYRENAKSAAALATQDLAKAAMFDASVARHLMLEGKGRTGRIGERTMNAILPSLLRSGQNAPAAPAAPPAASPEPVVGGSGGIGVG